jgi:hypothetical protein
MCCPAGVRQPRGVVSGRAADNVHRVIVETLKAEAKDYIGSPATEVEVPNQEYYAVVTGR